MFRAEAGKPCALLIPSPLNEGQYSSCGNYSSFYDSCSATELMNAKSDEEGHHHIRTQNMKYALFPQAAHIFSGYGKGERKQNEKV